MRRDIRDFYDLKTQRVRRQRTERDDKPMNEMKISHMAQQPSAFRRRNLSYNVSAIFASRDEGGFCNVRSHALFARYSLLKQKGLLVLVYNA